MKSTLLFLLDISSQLSKSSSLYLLLNIHPPSKLTSEHFETYQAIQVAPQWGQEGYIFTPEIHY